MESKARKAMEATGSKRKLREANGSKGKLGEARMLGEDRGS